MTTHERRVFFDDGGANVEYTVSGAGKRLLMVHGVQLAFSEYADFREILSARYTVYDLHRRGWGSSCAKSRDYHVAQESDDILYLLEDQKIDALYGYGYGALLALDAVIRHPVSKLMLDEPVLASELGNLNWVDRLERQRRSGDYPAALTTFVKHTYSKTRVMPAPLLRFMFKRISVDRDKEVIARTIACDDPDLDAAMKEDVESREWKQRRMMIDNIAQELHAAQAYEQTIPKVIPLAADVLIHCDADDQGHVKRSCTQLQQRIPGSSLYRTSFGAHPEHSQIRDYLDHVTEFFGGE